MNNILIQCGDHYENQTRLLGLALFLKNNGYNPIMILYKKFNGNLFLQNGIDTISVSSIEKSKYSWKFRNKAYSLNMSYKKIMIKDIYNMDILKTPYLFTGVKLKHRIEKAIIKIDAIDNIIKKTSPIFIFIWNGYTGIVANIFRAYCIVNKINQAYLERGFLSNSVFIDEKGTNGSSGLSKLTKIPELKSNHIYQNIIKKDYLNNNLIPAKFLNKKIIFIPLQVQNDTNILLYSQEIKTMRQLILLVHSNMKSDYICIVRPHPEEDENTNLNLPIFDNLIITSEGDLKQWILLSSIIVNINSTVGLESLLENKKVISFGNSIYANKKLSIDTNIEDFTLEDEKLFIPEPLNIKNYYNYLIEMHTCYNHTGTLWLKNNFPLLKKERKKLFFNDRKIDVLKLNQDLSFKINQSKIKLNKINSIYIIVDLNNKDVNLTYRKFNIPIDREYILEQAHQFLLNTFKINFLNQINVQNIQDNQDDQDDQDNQKFNILMLDENKKNFNKNINYDLIIDPYFNIHPLNSIL